MRVCPVICFALLIAALTLATGCGNAASKNGGNAGGDNNSSATGNATNGNATAATNTNTPAGNNFAENLANSDGLCPVTGEPASGDFILVHEGRIWAFASEEARRTFLDNPDQYLALAGGN